MIRKKNFSLSKIKKILIQKGYGIYKQQNKNKSTYLLKNFFLTALIGLILISFFTALPAINKYTKIKLYTSITENNSKINFEKVLSGKELELKPEEIEKLTFKDLFFDVFDFQKLPDDTVRLSASTLEELFKEIEYSVKEIRSKKLVKPISIDLLPKEMKSIENIKKKKELFIGIILPLIIEENNRIMLNRKKLFFIMT